eukprot:SAG11_NODE_3044_length_2734_cov_24.397723_3_plen_90_part_00
MEEVEAAEADAVPKAALMELVLRTDSEQLRVSECDGGGGGDGGGGDSMMEPGMLDAMIGSEFEVSGDRRDTALYLALLSAFASLPPVQR